MLVLSKSIFVNSPLQLYILLLPTQLLFVPVATLCISESKCDTLYIIVGAGKSIVIRLKVESQDWQ